MQFTAFEVRELIPAHHVRPAFEEVVNARMEARTAVETRSCQVSQPLQAKAEANWVRQAAQNLTSTTRGETSAFLAVLTEYRRNPALVRTRLRAETLRQVMPKIVSKSFLPPNQDGARILLQPRHVTP